MKEQEEEQREGYKFTTQEELEEAGYLQPCRINDIDFYTTFPPTTLKLPKSLYDKVCTNPILLCCLLRVM